MSLRVQRIDNKPAVVNEEGTLTLTGVFQDEAGARIPGSALDSVTLELYDEEEDETINGHDGDSILANVDEDGRLELTLLPADNPIITEGEPGAKERHICLIRWTWDTDKGDSQVIEVDVVRIHRVPEA